MSIWQRLRELFCRHKYRTAIRRQDCVVWVCRRCGRNRAVCFGISAAAFLAMTDDQAEDPTMDKCKHDDIAWRIIGSPAYASALAGAQCLDCMRRWGVAEIANALRYADGAADYQFAVILRQAGTQYRVKGGPFLGWTPLPVMPEEHE